MREEILQILLSVFEGKKSFNAFDSMKLLARSLRSEETAVRPVLSVSLPSFFFFKNLRCSICSIRVVHLDHLCGITFTVISNSGVDHILHVNKAPNLAKGEKKVLENTSNRLETQKKIQEKKTNAKSSFHNSSEKVLDS